MHRAADVARAVGGVLRGSGDRLLGAVRTLDEAGEEDLSFLAGARYRDRARASRAGSILCTPADRLDGRDRIEVEDAYYALSQALRLFHPDLPAPPGIDPRAAVAGDAILASGVSVGPFAVIGARCRIGEGVVIGPGAVVGDDVEIGAGTVLHARAVVYHGCRLGARVVLHAGVVVGADGFGYAFHAGVHHKVPQVGNVVIEDDVEVGAGATIDRGALGSTVIGAGSKIDNLVMIAHNVVIGPGSILVAQSGVAGSARLGKGVVIAGQAGVAGHLSVGDGARVAAKSAVLQDLAAGVTAAGIPAIPVAAWRRAQAAFGRLPEILQRLRRLEREDREGKTPGA
jgi:UDP-3-O-[3-hydroxymyristoyl] glucosamine N-acyltransferase